MAYDPENVEHKDASPRSGSADHHEKEETPMVEALDDDPVYSYKEQRKIIGRVDRRLISVAGIIYMNSLMDRSNLPNAGIAGMNVDLGMVTGFRYSAVALVFFITYTFLQPPATILTRKIGPRPFLSGICFAWGVVMIGFGFVQNWVVLIPLRLLLGLFEAGYFPGIVYLISTWYSRYDMHKRYAGFYCLGLVASGLGGILAFGVQQMDGLGGLEGWRWIFIIFGLMTVAASFLGMAFLVDFPDVAIDKNHWKFISRDEIAFIMRRIAKDRNDASSEKFNFRRWAAAGKDWKLWVFAMQFFSLTTQAYALAFFLPIILNSNMGFSVAHSQLLSAPPYAAAGIVMFICAWVGDKYHVRAPLMLFTASLGLIGLPMLAYAEAVGARYFGCFLICAASNGGIPTVMAYQANNIRGQWKRAFASATLVGFGGLGGIAGSTVFRSQDAPQYIPGIWVCIGLNLLIVATTIMNTIIFRKQNAKADRGEVVLEDEPSFRYTI